ncbi:hypothetical protein BT63DRAFT_450581 [Microthyrium microscopicum]|uniref:UBA domain-containing protein n=1 Tax=Microthyrium microscopicum TaxID=703497 RepID=A0A6A6UJV6_9PEZI|nr:hypothetical protein BT63DRAFT_450581 [Microthyrium microscopicum]
MDDLNGLDWNSPAKSALKPTPQTFPSLRPTPSPSISGRSTPSAFRPPTTSSSLPSQKIGSKPATPANDSFASLLSSGPAKSTNNLSLQERQRLLQEEKAKKAKQLDSHFGSLGAAGWNGTGSSNGSLGALQPSKPSTPQPIAAPGSGNTKKDEAVEDILAAFNSSAKVDASSHFPPQLANSGRSTPANVAPKPPFSNAFPDDDDDPFGLSQFTAKQPIVQPAPSASQDDDILGMLSRPVDEFAAPEPQREERPALDSSSDEEDNVPSNAQDKAAAELVDMGFSLEKAAIALAQTDSGTDVQAAVGILLNQAHEESRKKTRPASDREDVPSQRRPQREVDSGARRRPGDDSMPSWMKNQDESRSSSRNSNQASKEKDVTQYASEIGSSFLKSAGSLWKTSQKKVQRVVADLNQPEGDTNQPKWMRDAQLAEAAEKSAAQKKAKADVTDEAMMLESGDGRPSLPSRPSGNRQPARVDSPDSFGSKSRNPFENRSSSPQESFRDGLGREATSRSASRLTRQDLEKETPQPYVSAARRRKPQTSPANSTPEPIPAAPARVKSPLSSPPTTSSNPFLNVSQKPARQTPSPTPPRPRAPPRQIPPASSSALSTSASHRQTGTEAFKRGDYASAHAAYSSALSPLPSTHPVTIIVLCNRALANIKVGEPKAAVADAENALEIIGVSRGEGEKIALGGTEGTKDMKEFYGKALMRKAEALEHMEKWADAASVWRLAVEAGVGGGLAIQGRNRCEKAAGGGSQQPRAQSSAPRAAAARPKPAAPVRRPQVNTAASADAVKKLRAANAAAEKADDEKFSLMDQVDAKLLAWRGSKADNLRALLGSLDKVLWEEANWKKVGMHELVMANKVKIVYMKAIAKVHPDKVSQTASTEQKMISSAVFSTLNEAWDKFKAENNL